MATSGRRSRTEESVEFLKKLLELAREVVQADREQVAEEGAAAHPREQLTNRVTPIVAEITGATPREVRVVETALGLIAFVTLAMPADIPVAEAHRLASVVEQTIHDRIPEIHELVVHTEP